MLTYYSWSAEDTAAINIYFQHYNVDPSGDLTKNRGPLSGRYSFYTNLLHFYAKIFCLTGPMLLLELFVIQYDYFPAP